MSTVSRLTQLLGRARTAVEPVAKMAKEETVKQYQTLMANNQQYVVKDPEAANKLLRQWVFTQLSKWVLLGDGRGFADA
jgi:hypothetical protein